MVNATRPDLTWDAHDHADLVPYMVACLRNDGHAALAEFIDSPVAAGEVPLAGLMTGAREADYPTSRFWVNVGAHFHDPCSHRGLGWFPYSGADAAARVWRAALAAWQSGDVTLAMIHIGRCLHLLGDIGGIPHHAAGIGYLVRDPYGHRDFENWLRDGDHWRSYAVTSGGYYAPWRSYHRCGQAVHVTVAGRPFDWIDQAAATAKSLLPAVDKHNAGYQARFPGAAAVLVPSIIRYGAGFIHAFLRDPSVISAWPGRRSD
ncbi:MAG: hypothetical protein ACM3XN_04975 [Chloroflexota bacterium]